MLLRHVRVDHNQSVLRLVLLVEVSMAAALGCESALEEGNSPGKLCREQFGFVLPVLAQTCFDEY